MLTSLAFLYAASILIGNMDNANESKVKNVLIFFYLQVGRSEEEGGKNKRFHIFEECEWNF